MEQPAYNAYVRRIRNASAKQRENLLINTRLITEVDTRRVDGFSKENAAGTLHQPKGLSIYSRRLALRGSANRAGERIF